MKALLLTPSADFGEFMQVVDEDVNDLQTCYKLLGCELIDIVHRRCYTSKDDFFEFDVICDDEGLFKESNLPVLALDWVDHTPDKEFIVGKVLICGRADDEGYQTSLDPATALAITSLSHVKQLSVSKTLCLSFPACADCFK